MSSFSLCKRQTAAQPFVFHFVLSIRWSATTLCDLNAVLSALAFLSVSVSVRVCFHFLRLSCFLCPSVVQGSMCTAPAGLFFTGRSWLLCFGASCSPRYRPCRVQWPSSATTLKSYLRRLVFPAQRHAVCFSPSLIFMHTLAGIYQLLFLDPFRFFSTRSITHPRATHCPSFFFSSCVKVDLSRSDIFDPSVLERIASAAAALKESGSSKTITAQWGGGWEVGDGNERRDRQ